MDYTLLADIYLVGMLANSDPLAYREIYHRYWKQVYLLALRKTGSREISEELTQDVFVSLWEKRASRSIDHLAAYLNTAVRYRVIDFIRAELTKNRYLGGLKAQPSPLLSTDPEDVAISKELSKAIQSAVLKLPEQTREIFKLSRFEHKRVKEIALSFSLSEKAVEYHITKALKAMRLYLKDYMLLVLLCLIY